MDSETFLGVILIAGWAAMVLRGLARTALAARKGRKWEQAYLVGSGVGCALGVGVVLSIKNSLPFDTFGLSFFLAAGAGFAIWAFGRRVPTAKRKPVRSVLPTYNHLRTTAGVNFHQGKRELPGLILATGGLLSWWRRLRERY